MTVRVTKPEFNLREKISELDKPTGLKGSELMRSETPQEARDLIGANSGRKNLFINGDMRIDQRSQGVATIPSGTSFTSVDRWKAVINPGSKFSMQRKNDASLPGFPFYMRLTVTTAQSSMGGSQYQLFWQTIESKNIFDRTGFGTGSNAKDLTLSFWVRSSVAGPFSGSLENWAQDRAFVWEVDIKNKDTWEYKTVHIPPCTDGGWQISTTNGAYFMFSLGTTIASTPNVGWVNAQRLGSNTEIRRIGIQGCTVDITGCQLEIGRVATEFNHTSFTEELNLCRRYYQVIVDQNDTGSQKSFGIACAYSSTSMHSVHLLQPEMRGTLTLDYTTGSNYYRAFYNNTADYYDQMGLVGNSHSRAADIMVLSGLSVTQGNAVLLRTINNAARVAVSSEI